MRGSMELGFSKKYEVGETYILLNGHVEEKLCEEMPWIIDQRQMKNLRGHETRSLDPSSKENMPSTDHLRPLD
jgi:hypothetical protein